MSTLRIPGLGRRRDSDAAIAPAQAVDLSSDETDFDSRLAWILGSPRTGSTWLLRMIIHPWRLAQSPTGIRAPRRMPPGAPSVVPVNESHIPNHLTPFKFPRGELHTDASLEQPSPGEFLKNHERADDPGYFFSDHYAAAWKAGARQMILDRFRAQAERAAQELGMRDPLVVIKEPNGSHGAELVMSLLPRSRLLFLMRDGRDVVDSQIALRTNQGPWAKKRGVPTVADAEARLNMVQLLSRLWVNNMNAVQNAYDAHDPELRMMVRYEDLLSDTEPVLGPILEWLGLARSKDDLRETVTSEAFEKIPEKQKGPGHGKRAASPGLWRENLTEDEQTTLERVAGPKLRDLGYG